jgi:hypothetical protein
MSDRVWSVEELTIVHPLPDGWTWSVAQGIGVSDVDPMRPWAFGVGDQGVEVGGDGALLALDGNGRRFDPPADVALAVVLASKGRDSFEAMAREADRLAAWVIEAGGRIALRDLAAMLRRGR